MYTHGTLVQFSHPKTGDLTIGLVNSPTKRKFEILFMQGESIKLYRASAKHSVEFLVHTLRVSPLQKENKKLVPKDLLERQQEFINPVKYAAGDIVSLECKGKTVSGRVQKGGVRLQVAIDGGKLVVSGPASIATKIEYPIPGCETMKDWNIKSYRVIRGHDDSEPFDATICYKGKPVIHAGNDGWGGCNTYHLVKPEYRDLLEQFRKDANAWWKEATGAEPKQYSENEDLWIFYEWYVRPSGITPKDYLADFPK